MTFKQCQALMKRVGTVFLATTDGERPRVRPMSAYAWFGGELWMATGTRSAKMRDLRSSPLVDVCCMARNYNHVRLAGRCRVSRSAADKKAMFGAFPWMSRFFGSANDPDWAVLRITPLAMQAMGADMEYSPVELPAA